MANPPKRKLLSGKISLLSLVPAGANEVISLFKSAGAVEMAALSKINAEGYLTTLVYRPDTVDSQGDIAAKSDIQQWAHDFIPNMEGNGIDVLHDCQPVGNERAHICETFIVQKGDPRFEGLKDHAGNPIDPTGSWGVIIKIDDPDLRSRYATGEWVGVSMFGSATVEPVTVKSSQTPPQENDMDDKQMAELLKKFETSIIEGLAKALTPKPEPKPEPKAEVKFEGDPLNAEDLAKHADKVFLASCDLNTVEGLAKWQGYLGEKKAEEQDEVEETPEINALQKQIAALKKASANSAESTPAPAGPKTLAEKLAKGSERAARLRKDGVIK